MVQELWAGNVGSMITRAVIDMHVIRVSIQRSGHKKYRVVGQFADWNQGKNKMVKTTRRRGKRDRNTYERIVGCKDCFPIGFNVIQVNSTIHVSIQDLLGCDPCCIGSSSWIRSMFIKYIFKFESWFIRSWSQVCKYIQNIYFVEYRFTFYKVDTNEWQMNQRYELCLAWSSEPIEMENIERRESWTLFVIHDLGLNSSIPFPVYLLRKQIQIPLFVSHVYP